MSELNEKNRRDYSKYDEMSTDALEQILRLDFQASEDAESDMDAILYISEALAKRNGQSAAVDVDAAWEQFQTKYLPYADGRSLYDFDDEDSASAPKPEKASDPSPQHQRPPRIPRLRRLAVVAAILAAALLTVTATAYALGYDLWGVIAQWTKDTFTFVSTTDAAPDQEHLSETHQGVRVPDVLDYESLREALGDHGITELLVPTWIPDRYLDAGITVEVMETAVETLFSVCYMDNGQALSIIITQHQDSSNVTYMEWQKDDEEVERYESGGITHYLMHNAGDPSAVWTNREFECSIFGQITEEELVRMINSIYDPEDGSADTGVTS